MNPSEEPNARCRQPWRGAVPRRISAGPTLAALALFFLSLTGCGDDATEPGGEEASATRHLFKEEGLTGVRGLRVESVNGAIEISTGAVERISIEVFLEVRAQTDRLARDVAGSVRIESERVGSVLGLRAEYPEPPPGVVVEADWSVRVPFGLAVELAVANGAVSVHGKVGALVAEVQNGAVVLRGSAGPVEISTVNGAFDVDLEQLLGSGTFTSINGLHHIGFASGDGSIEASATNGEIYLGLPSSYSGVLDAMTGNGEVSCTLPLEDVEISTLTHLRGALGDGGSATVDLRTVNGNVAVNQHSGSWAASGR